MDPVTGLLLLSLLGTGVKIGADYFKGRKQAEYTDQVEQYEEEQRKKAELAARRNALARAIKSKAPASMPQPGDPAPTAPDTKFLDIASGLGELGAQGGALFASKVKPKVKTTTPAVETKVDFSTTKDLPIYG